MPTHQSIFNTRASLTTPLRTTRLRLRGFAMFCFVSVATGSALFWLSDNPFLLSFRMGAAPFCSGLVWLWNGSVDRDHAFEAPRAKGTGAPHSFSCCRACSRWADLV